jgi:hypothetical protein
MLALGRHCSSGGGSGGGRAIAGVIVVVRAAAVAVAACRRVLPQKEAQGSQAHRRRAMKRSRSCVSWHGTANKGGVGWRGEHSM